MKTIREIAGEVGLSRQAVYKHVAEAGLSLDELTAKKQGNQRLFDEEAVSKITEACRRNVKEVPSDTTELTAELREAKATIEALRDQLEEARGRISRLEKELHEERESASSERGRLLDQLASMTEALKASSVINASLIATNKRGLIQRIKDFLPSKTQN